MAEARLRPAEERWALTETELRTLRLIAEGKTDRQIGAEVCNSPETIHNHRRAIFLKLGAHNRAEAVAVGFRKGLLT
jgi:DNA-binding NarL/FixJ family response regulator